MSKNKLKKFSEMETIPFVFQYPYARIQNQGFPYRGRWRQDVFDNDNPIVVELGCGKGEYTVGLAAREPHKNYIGIDIKGARMHTGAVAALKAGMTNVAFVRTSIEMLDAFFALGEVNEIWITFPDPQMKKTRKRLTSSRFLDLYRRVLSADGVVHLKTDSPFLYAYTTRLIDANPRVFTLMRDTADLYADTPVPGEHLDIRTHYEQQWLDRGLSIKYLKFAIDPNETITEVDDSDIEQDTYRSYSRGYIQMPQLMNEKP